MYVQKKKKEKKGERGVLQKFQALTWPSNLNYCRLLLLLGGILGVVASEEEGGLWAGWLAGRVCAVKSYLNRMWTAIK